MKIAVLSRSSFFEIMMIAFSKPKSKNHFSPNQVEDWFTVFDRSSRNSRNFRNFNRTQDHKKGKIHVTLLS